VSSRRVGKCERLSPRLLLQDSNNKRDPPSQNSGRPLNALLRIVLPDDRRRDLPAGRYGPYQMKRWY